MKEIKIKNIIFTYNCIKQNNPIKDNFIDILKKVSKKINIIIINDDLYTDFKMIIDYLRLDETDNNITMDYPQ